MVRDGLRIHVTMCRTAPGRCSGRCSPSRWGGPGHPPAWRVYVAPSRHFAPLRGRFAVASRTLREHFANTSRTLHEHFAALREHFAALREHFTNTSRRFTLRGASRTLRGASRSLRGRFALASQTLRSASHSLHILHISYVVSEGATYTRYAGGYQVAKSVSRCLPR